MDYDKEWLRLTDPKADAEYLLGMGRWHDDTDGFVARRPHSMCWTYLVAARRLVPRSAWQCPPPAAEG